MIAYFKEALRPGELVWSPRLGMGYCAPPDGYERIYDDKYFNNYAQMKETPLGKKLNEFRVTFVCKHSRPTSEVLDYGCGAGAFVHAARHTSDLHVFGYDVMEDSVKYLRSTFCFGVPNMHHAGWDVLTFWDSLEHLQNPDEIVSLAREWVFISMPIYNNGEHVLRSKHFKPGEHLWYWTSRGLIDFMDDCGFQCVECVDTETVLGREGILTYAFKRRHETVR